MHTSDRDFELNSAESEEGQIRENPTTMKDIWTNSVTLLAATNSVWPCVGPQDLFWLIIWYQTNYIIHWMTSLEKITPTTYPRFRKSIAVWEKDNHVYTRSAFAHIISHLRYFIDLYSYYFVQIHFPCKHDYVLYSNGTRFPKFRISRRCNLLCHRESMTSHFYLLNHVIVFISLKLTSN